MQLLSVIICTHNPRRTYIERVLQALESQTLPKDVWELLLIDNASQQPLAPELDISWHPHGKHVREDQLGLTPARLRGIREATTELLVFVDDDNVLNEDYLEVVEKISRNYPFIGAWGGQIHPEFEVQPPEWTKTYWGYLAISEFEKDKWSNLVNQYETTPSGAGLCVRKWIAQKYAYILNNDTVRRSFGRKGKTLSSCEDSDLAFTACDLDMGTGKFTSLHLTHLIPKERLQEDYLLRLIEGMTTSGLILESLRGQPPIQKIKKSPIAILFQTYGFLRMQPRDRRFYQARQRALEKAREILCTLEGGDS